MHLLIIAPEQIPVPPIKGGSVEISIYHIAKELAASHQVTIISRTHSSYPSLTREGNLTIIRVPGGTPGRYLTNVLVRLSGQTFDWIQVDNRPLFVPRVKQRYPNTPVSLFLHSLTFISPSRIAHARATRCLSQADLIVANSLSLQGVLKERYPQLNTKIKKIWLGADLHRFRPPVLQERKKLRSRYRLNESFVVAFAGRLIPRKGLPLLIRAIRLARKEVPAIRLVVAGKSQNAKYGARVRKYARQCRVPAIFMGQLSHRNMNKLYWMADCFVCPSQKHEAFGLVNVEAMATGLPCIASNVGGIGEIVRDRHNGLLIDNYRNYRSFARSIVQLARNREWGQRLGKQAREDVIQRFDWKTTAANLVKLYDHHKIN
ncbi:glycosyltransferase family 4 protein [Paenibacillus sp. J2TS4]|uniref:glycosyltransferase family 4 protein n=1 Tax=Paenibacillus sp. J2TS4 TaxID=2807194 RepID=UPI001B04C8DD|nr:glycosyltransferase family 4 protein [Paenibacillus sp. J2TS4]GIP31087.1 hypothetical protein J2TS4_02970 [Paenibacillus sp. J2TS4]